MSWRLVIPVPTTSQNTRDRQHHMARHRSKGLWWWHIRAAPGFLLVPRATGRRRLTIERHARTQPQDEANVHGGCKGLVDDLVQLRLLIDDTPKWLEHGTPRHIPLAKGERAYTVLILEDCA